MYAIRSYYATLNADFRGKPTPTNVLSWPAEDLAPEEAGAAPERPEPFMPGEPEGLGDIAIAYETCLREGTNDLICIGDKPGDDSFSVA